MDTGCRYRKHTFVICAYKESEYLEECIQSVMNQSYPSRVIVATSTPNDHIRGLVHKYGLNLYINGGVTGIAGDWNFALGCASTPYVTIAHQDDIYLKDYARDMVNALDSQDAPLMGFTDYGELRNGSMVTDVRLLRIKKVLLFPLRSRRLQRSRFVRRRSLSFGSAICCPSVCYVKDRLPDPVFLEHFRASIDWQTWERVSRLDGSFVYVPRCLMGHRIHAGSETSAAIRDHVRTAEDYEMFRKFWPVPFARLLSRQYAKSEDSNEISDSDAG